MNWRTSDLYCGCVGAVGEPNRIYTSASKRRTAAMINEKLETLDQEIAKTAKPAAGGRSMEEKMLEHR